MIKVLRLDSTEKFVETLKPIAMRVTREVNGEDVIELELQNEVAKNDRIVCQDTKGIWYEYIVRGVETVNGSSGIMHYVFAESSVYELLGDWVDDKRPTNKTAAGALADILPMTRWTAGAIAVTGLKSTTFYRCSVYEAVKKILEVWGLELKARVLVSGNVITTRFIDMVESIGTNSGKRFVYGKDIDEITRNVQRADVITAMHGFGRGEEIGDGYGRRINFADINGGKMYVEDNAAREAFGRLTPNGTRTHVFGKVEFDDIEDKAVLLAETRKALDAAKVPQVTYEAKVIDLVQHGLSHEGVGLGDTVTVIDNDLGVRLQARVMRLVEYPLGEASNEVTIGNFTETFVSSIVSLGKKVSGMSARSAIWDRAMLLDQDGVKAEIIKGLMTEWNALMNEGLSGGEIQTFPGGFRFINDAQTWATEISTTGFRIANSKLANGEWNWQTIGTGNGFIADAMFANTILARIANLGYVEASEIRLGTAVLTEVVTAKARVFTALPQPPYAVGDLWAEGPRTVNQINEYGTVSNIDALGLTVRDIIGGFVYVCTFARSSGNFIHADWKLVSVDEQLERALADRVTVNESRLTNMGLTIEATTYLVNKQGEDIGTAQQDITDIRAGQATFVTKQGLSQPSYTTINGGNITTGLLRSPNGATQINMDTGTLNLANGNLVWDNLKLLVKGEIQSEQSGRLAHIRNGQYMIFSGTAEILNISNFVTPGIDAFITLGSGGEKLRISKSINVGSVDYDFMIFDSLTRSIKALEPVTLDKELTVSGATTINNALTVANKSSFPGGADIGRLRYLQYQTGSGFRDVNSNIALIVDAGKINVVNTTTNAVVKQLYP